MTHMSYSPKSKQPMTPEERLAQAKHELAQGNPDQACAHALIAIAEAFISCMELSEPSSWA